MIAKRPIPPSRRLSRPLPAVVAGLALHLCAQAAPEPIRLDAGSLRLTLDDKGRVVEMAGPAGGNLADRERPSSLLMLQGHGEGALQHPTGLREESLATGGRRLVFTYPNQRSATVEATPRNNYLRLKLVSVTPVAEIARISWGPLHTTMRDAIAEYLGLVRDADFTIGMLSLEPNTDGRITNGGHYHVAAFNGAGGSFLQALAQDRTRTGPGEAGYFAHGLPGVTVAGSAIALFGCGRRAELDIVDAISQGEKLPRPLINGVWCKRSEAHFVPALWVHYDRDNLDAFIEMARLFGAGSLCNFHDTFANWGHFEPEPKLYPRGMPDLRQVVSRCRDAGVDHVMYTLSTFLRPHTRPEPFLAPDAHPDLQFLPPLGTLAKALDDAGDHLVLRDEPGLREILGGHLRVDGELIRCGKIAAREGEIHITGCGRGAMGTGKRSHPVGAKVARLPQHFMESFTPGTIRFQDEVADRIAQVARDAGFAQITLDGYESCLRTGHGAYAKNRFITRIFDRVGNPGLRFTPSNFGNYDWHLMSYVSWGEYDLVKGFRGTMLDYRLRRQLQLASNHMPHKLGQYYPDNASPEDMHWLMALAAGWNAGVDMHFTKAAPQSENIRQLGGITRLWMEARKAGAFTEADKLSLRQTDRLHTLSRDAAGSYHLDFMGRWRHPGVEELPASAFRITGGGQAGTEPCGIDWSWTHNPGIYRKAGLSEDLVAPADGKAAEWQVTWPANDRLFFVLRLPAGAPGAIRNPVVTLNGIPLMIPVTLQPGQYLSTTHDMSLVSIYDSNHEVIGEANIQCLPYRLPSVEGGRQQTVGLAAETAGHAGQTPVMRLNLRAHVTFGDDI